MKLSTVTMATACAIAFTSLSAQAATKQYLNQKSDLNTMLKSASQTVLSTQPKVLIGLESASQLKELKSFSNKKGETTTRFQQTYHGLPVIGDTVILTFDDAGTLKKSTWCSGI